MDWGRAAVGCTGIFSAAGRSLVTRIRNIAGIGCLIGFLASIFSSVAFVMNYSPCECRFDNLRLTLLSLFLVAVVAS